VFSSYTAETRPAVPRSTDASVIRLQIQLHSETIKGKEFFRGSLAATREEIVQAGDRAVLVSDWLLFCNHQGVA